MGEDYFVSSFISGLKSELKPMVRLKPKSLLDAIEIAQFQEQTIEVLLKKHEFKKSTTVGWGKTANNKKNEGIVNEGKKNEGNVNDGKKNYANNYFKKISPEEFQYRKNNHLCYKCGEKFGQGHVCKNEQYTFMLIDETKEKEIVKLLEEDEEEEGIDGTITEVSLNVLSDSMSRKTITLEGSLQGRPIKILVDTGSSLTILNSGVAKELGIEGMVKENISVRLADGRTVDSNIVVPRLTWGVKNYKFCGDVRIMNIGGWDMSAGVDWLEQYSPILFDFKKLYLKLNAESSAEEHMVLQGVVKEVASIRLVEVKSETVSIKRTLRENYNKELGLWLLFLRMEKQKIKNLLWNYQV